VRTVFRILVFLGVVGILVAAIPRPTLAADNPQSVAVYSVRVFQNLWETGDQLFVVEYAVNYTTEPSQPASDLFCVALYDSSALKQSVPLNYYGHNVISIYLPQRQSLVWGGSYRIVVMGNPAYFDLQEDVNMDSYTLSRFNYIEGTASESREALKIWIVQLAEALEESWASLNIDLLNSNDELTVDGAVVFKKAIPNLEQIVPDLFATSVSYPGASGTLGSGVERRQYVGSRIRGALEGIGEFLHVPWWVVGALGVVVLYIILAGRIYLATGSTSLAMVLAVPFIIAGAILGLVPLAAMFIAAFIAILVFAIVFILPRLP
jgi:hypothetical protein